MIQFNIALHKRDLIFEIDQYAWQAGNNLLNGEGMERAAANVQCSDADRDVVERFLLSAVRDAEREFARYLTRTGDDIHYRGSVPDVLLFVVDVPDSFAMSQESALMGYLRDYLVYSTLMAWFKLVKLVDEVTVCGELSVVARHGFVECVNKRVKPVRRNLGRRWG